MSEQRPRLGGLHHVTLICRDAERTAGFYRDLLGMRLVEQTVNEDDRGARHVLFGDDSATIITCLEYPDLDEGKVGRGSTHHVALGVESEEELAVWRDYLRGQGIPCTDVMQRAHTKSVYLRDPDGHILELAAG